MRGCLKSCVGRTFGLVLLCGALYAAYRFGPQILPPGISTEVSGWFRGADEERPLPSADLAESTLDRVETLRAGEGGERLTLGPLELSSVVRYALPGIVPSGVTEPTVEMDDGKLVLSARVATDAFPELPSLRRVVGLLPDTVVIEMRGSLLPFDDENAAFHVDGVQAGGVPLPDRFVPEILEALGRRDTLGLPRDAIAVPLPDGLDSVYVLRDSLVLVADR